MSLKTSYTLIAPLYDLAVARATQNARRQSLERLRPLPPQQVLLSGMGTGLDLPYLPAQHRYLGLDLTPAMLARAGHRKGHLDLRVVQGDAQRLPFADHSFDCVVLHLILAVVPQSQACLQETARVLRPGGKVLIFDKFLQSGQRALFRRAMNPLMRRLATQLNVVFEEVLAGVPELSLQSDAPALAGGWFRWIQLMKNT